VARISRSHTVVSRKRQPGPRRPGFNSPCRNLAFVSALHACDHFVKEVGTQRKLCCHFLRCGCECRGFEICLDKFLGGGLGGQGVTGNKSFGE
jgi:hypothetical protein